MTYIISLLLTSISLFGMAQNRGPASRLEYKGMSEIELLDSISFEHLRHSFSTGNTRVSYIFRLDSAGTFEHLEFGDVITLTLDSGTWRIKDQNILVLESKTSKYCFNIVRFHTYLFFIKPEQRRDFVKDLSRQQGEFISSKEKVNEHRYNRAYLIAFHLMRKYYVANLDE